MCLSTGPTSDLAPVEVHLSADAGWLRSQDQPHPASHASPLSRSPSVDCLRFQLLWLVSFLVSEVSFGVSIYDDIHLCKQLPFRFGLVRSLWPTSRNSTQRTVGNCLGGGQRLYSPLSQPPHPILSRVSITHLGTEHRP